MVQVKEWKILILGLGILFILIVVVAISGWTNDTNLETNIINNTYTGNGITFKYPSDWSQNTSTNVKRLAEPVVTFTKADGDNIYAFNVFVNDSGGNTLNSFINKYRKTGTTINEEPVKIAGVTGHRIYNTATTQGGGNNLWFIFVKNGKIYTLLFSDYYVIQDDINTIVNSFQTT
jgi:PsbP-like protein